MDNQVWSGGDLTVAPFTVTQFEQAEDAACTLCGSGTCRGSDPPPPWWDGQRWNPEIAWYCCDDCGAYAAVFPETEDELWLIRQDVETPADELKGPELDRAVEREVFDVHRPAGSPTIHAYSADLRHARDVEKQIDQLGLYDEYAEALLAELVPSQPRTSLGVVDILPYDDLFRLIHASPAERCRAALTAVRKATEPS